MIWEEENLSHKCFTLVRLVVSKYNFYMFILVFNIEISEILITINSQYKIYELKRQCPDAKILHIEVSLYTLIEDQISTPIAKIFFLPSVIVKVVGVLVHYLKSLEKWMCACLQNCGAVEISCFITFNKIIHLQSCVLVIEIIYYLLCFSLKEKQIVFSSIYSCLIKFVYLVVPSVVIMIANNVMSLEWFVTIHY